MNKSLTRFRFYCGIVAMLLSSCAIKQPLPSQLPADTAMNRGAGRGDPLIVTVELEDGEKLPFLVDSGAPFTCFDKSMESELGKSYGTLRAEIEDSEYNATIHKAPRLFLGKTQLMNSADYICVIDLRMFSFEAAQTIMGVIGEDILRNYCIQLDFTNNTIRFLDGKKSDKSGWGKPFPLHRTLTDLVYIRDNLAGDGSSPSVVDLGCVFDGWLKPGLYRRWADNKGQARYPNVILGEETYTNVALLESSLHQPANPFPIVHYAGYNGIGLHLLARNLVTLDFPENMMYLRRTSVGPLVDSESIKTEMDSVHKFLVSLKEKGALPGWPKDDKSPLHGDMQYVYPETFYFKCVQKDSTVFEYMVFRSSKGVDWELMDAWQSKGKGKPPKPYPAKYPIR